MRNFAKVWSCSRIAWQFVRMFRKKVSILYKQKPCEVNIGPHNTVILKLLKSNVNLQLVTSVYTMLAYLTSYLCKPEHTIANLFKRDQRRLLEKILKVNCFLLVINKINKERKVSTNEANIDALYVPAGLKKNRTRMLKLLSILEKMHPDDTNVFASNIIDK